VRVLAPVTNDGGAPAELDINRQIFLSTLI